MTTDRKIESNRKNAKKSTGPRSKTGLQRSGRNAWRHGLSLAIGSDASFSDDVKQLASIIARSDSGQKISEFAYQFAEAEFDLLRIRKLRVSRIRAVLGNVEIKLEDRSKLDDELAKLERYEKRAYSKRKRALRAMTQS